MIRFTGLIWAIAGLASLVAAGDWPQWRGAQRDGKSVETGLLQKWPDGGPPRKWKAEGLGDGYSTVAVTQGHIYTLGQRGETEYVMALDEATGKKVWETAAGGAYMERRGDGPRGVPTVEGDKLWAITADGKLVCLDSKTGKLIWKADFVGQFGGSIPHWGYSESPLIDGEKVVVTPGGGGHSVVALDKKTGKLIWKSQSDGAAYSSVSVATVGPTRLYIAFTSSGVVGLRADNGEKLWSYDKVSNRTANVATPIVSGNQVFVSSDYGTGCALLTMDADGAKGVNVTEVYFSREMKNHHATSIMIGEHLYGFNSSILTAMKWSSGEVAWRDRSTGKGSVVYADGHLIVVGENGAVALVKVGTGAYAEVSRFSLELSGRPAWAHPVVANGNLYIRDQNVLYCYRLQPS